MKRDKTFTCQRCDKNIQIDDIDNTPIVACHGCGQEYRVQYVEEPESIYELVPIEPVEGRNRAEMEEDEPFRVLDEPAAPREDDLDRYP